MIYIIIAILIYLSGCANGIMDTLQFHYKGSIFEKLNEYFWNPAKSWVNKYKHLNGELIKPLAAKFPGSITWLVFTTDAWHLFKFIYNGLIKIIIIILILSNYNFPFWKHAIFAIVIWIGIFLIQALGFRTFYKLRK
jgi:hypothetical protein